MATPEIAPADVDATWAETGTVADLGDISGGWPVGKPGRGRTNNILKWIHQGVRYLLHAGLPLWRSSGAYAVGDRCQGSDGKGYVALLASTSASPKDPTSQPTYWAIWGHTDAQVNTLIDAKLGALGGMLADGTVTPTGASVATYVSVMKSPGVSNKSVDFQLALHNTVGGWVEVLTLSGGAVFAAGLDGGSACLTDPGDITTASSPIITVKVLTPTTVQVSVVNATTTGSAIHLEVHLRGH